VLSSTRSLPMFVTGAARPIGRHAATPPTIIDLKISAMTNPHTT
jgi:hypothetical protein